MLSNDVVADGQPQAGAVFLCGKEWIKNKRQSLLAYRRTCIMEIHTQTLTVRAGMQVYADLATLIRLHRFHGIHA